MNSPKLNSVTLPDGQNAIMFTEQPSKQLGIVDVATIQRLAEMLPSVPFFKIRINFTARIESTNNLEEMVEVIREEFNFHTTVNLLKEYKPEQEEQTIAVKAY